jgi:hypothetical protein
MSRSGGIYYESVCLFEIEAELCMYVLSPSQLLELALLFLPLTNALTDPIKIICKVGRDPRVNTS